MYLTKSAGNVCERVTIGFSLTSDWMKKWREFFRPVDSNATKSTANVNYMDTQNNLTALITVPSDRSFPICLVAVLSLLSNEKRGKVLKKLWFFISGEYNKIIWFYQLG